MSDLKKEMVKVNILTLGRLPLGLTGPLEGVIVSKEYYNICKGSGVIIELVEEVKDEVKEKVVDEKKEEAPLPPTNDTSDPSTDIDDNKNKENVPPISEDETSAKDETTEDAPVEEETSDETEADEVEHSNTNAPSKKKKKKKRVSSEE